MGYFALTPNPGPSWKLEDFDFDHDYKRLSAAALVAPTNPDLRGFKAAGGKILSYTGWNDAVEGVLGTVDYYETAERVVGGRAETQDFFRLFVVPGMNHCGGGDGASDVDWLSYLEAWVEKGEEPERVIGGSHVREGGESDFSRPIYPYPTRTKYLGRGDPNDAENFGPDEP